MKLNSERWCCEVEVAAESRWRYLKTPRHQRFNRLQKPKLQSGNLCANNSFSLSRRVQNVSQSSTFPTPVQESRGWGNAKQFINGSSAMEANYYIKGLRFALSALSARFVPAFFSILLLGTVLFPVHIVFSRWTHFSPPYIFQPSLVTPSLALLYKPTLLVSFSSCIIQLLYKADIKEREAIQCENGKNVRGKEGNRNPCFHNGPLDKKATYVLQKLLSFYILYPRQLFHEKCSFSTRFAQHYPTLTLLYPAIGSTDPSLSPPIWLMWIDLGGGEGWGGGRRATLKQYKVHPLSSQQAVITLKQSDFDLIVIVLNAWLNLIT